MRWALFAFGMTGAAIFGLILAVTFISPIQVERAARVFIQTRIEQQVSGIVGGLEEKTLNTRVGVLAETLLERQSKEIGLLREQLAAGASAEIAAVVARLQDVDCECRQRMLQGLDAAAKLRISALQRAEPQLRRIIEGQYRQIILALLRDLRIFAATNFVAFALLALLPIVLPARARQLAVPGLLLGLSAIAAAAAYVFGQNWFFTILYANYVGWAYGLWLVVVFALFCDIVLLRAKVTTMIVNAVASFGAPPC